MGNAESTEDRGASFSSRPNGTSLTQPQSTMFAWSRVNASKTMGEEVWWAAAQGDATRLKYFRTQMSSYQTHEVLEWMDDKLGLTPLMIAARQGHVECLEILVDAGASMYAVDFGSGTKGKGNTALHWACSQQAYLGVIRIFLVQEDDVCNFFALNRMGYTPLDLLRAQYEQFKQAQLLECIQLYEEKTAIYRGWLYHCVENEVRGFSGLSTWSKRYCMVFPTGTSLCYELVLYKASTETSRTAASASIWYEIAQSVQRIESRPDHQERQSLNGKPHSFKLRGCAKRNFCSSALDSKREHKFAADDESTLMEWLDFFSRSKDTSNSRGIIIEEATSPTAPAGGTNEEVLTNADTVEGEMVQSTHLLSVKSDEVIENKLEAPPIIKSKSREHDNDYGECVICMEAKQTAVCVPCGHNATCMECLRQAKEKSMACPVCRVPIREVVRLYKV